MEVEDIMDREQLDLLLEIMEVSFVLDETALYLNIQPNDERALRLHNNSASQYAQLLDMYQARYGLLRNEGMSRYPWSYIDDPWPWDVNFNNC